MLKKRWALMLLALCLAAAFTGCSLSSSRGSLKDNLMESFDHWMQSLSNCALTREKDLHSRRRG